MDVSNPIWNAQESSYLFTFTGNFPTVNGSAVSENSQLALPDFTKQSCLEEILTTFLEKTKRFFVTPLQLETVKKYLHHHIEQSNMPREGEYFVPVWKPSSMKMKSSEFGLYWSVVEWKPSEPLIQPNFFRSKTPQPLSLPPEPNLRTIHIQNGMDSLVPVGDLPLSDLPPLNFGESPEKKEVRRRIREARLKVELARLKAKRMEQRYYERYGEDLEGEDSSLESSESESDGVGKYSYS